MVSASEAIGTLDLVKYIILRISYVERGKVVIYVDNKKILNEYTKQINKESEVSIEVAGVITEIRDKIIKATIDILP